MTEKTEEQKNLEKVYQKLLEIRKREDLELKPLKYLRDEIEIGDGQKVPLRLRYYQVQGVLHLLAMKRFVLGDDTGLGKTAQTITALSYLWQKDPSQKAIILTTKSAVPQWAGEFKKFTTGIKTFMVKGGPKKRRKIYDEFLEYDEGPRAIIMNYAKVRTDFLDVFQHWNPDVFVMDEITAVKNPSAKISKCCKHISKNSERVWGLSATIIKNNLIEGYGIYKVVVPPLFSSKNKFMHNYCRIRYQSIPNSRRKIPVIIGYHDRDIAAFREKIDPFFVGRAKIDVADELPALTTREITVNLSNSQRELYDEALSGVLRVGQGEDAEEKEVTKLTAVTYCQQVVNHPKLIEREGKSSKFKQLTELILKGDLQEEKVIVFSRFKKMVDIICPYLNEKAKSENFCVRITGNENDDQRADSQRRFQDPNSDTKVVCITMAGADAINLQMAKAIVFYDLPWSAGDYIQILGRMIRLGSIHTHVYAIHLVTRGTIDRRASQILKNKMDVFEKVLGKRIKGDGSGMVKVSGGGVNELFEMLREDAGGKPAKKTSSNPELTCTQCGAEMDADEAKELDVCFSCLFG